MTLVFKSLDSTKDLKPRASATVSFKAAVCRISTTDDPTQYSLDFEQSQE